MSDCNNSVTKYFVVQPASSGTTDSYVTGVTINSNTLELGRNQGLSTLSVSLSQFLDNTDRFLTGATMNANILELSRSGGLSNVSVDLSQFTGGTAGTDTNYYVTGQTLNGTILETSRNGGLVTLSTELSGLTSASTPIDYSDVYVNVTGDTMSGDLYLENDLILTGKTDSQFRLIGTGTKSSPNFSIYGNGSTILQSSSLLRIYTPSIFLVQSVSAGKTSAYFDPAGKVEFKHNNVDRIETTVDGTTLTGEISILNSLSIGSIGSGTSVTNLGWDSSGNVVSGGTFTSFNVSGDMGQETIEDSNTLLLYGGEGIKSIVTATDTVTHRLDITGTTVEASPVSGAKLVIYQGGEHRNIDWDDLPGAGGGETNTASNQGVGQGVYKQKTGVDLEFYSLSGGTNVTTTLNGDTIVIDVGSTLRNITTSETILSTDFTINVTTTSDTTQTLPTAVGVQGKIYNVKNSDSTGTSTITMNTTSSQLMDDNASGTITILFPNSLTFQSDNSNWILI